MNKITCIDGKLHVPEHVVIPYITGDGVGSEIMPVCQTVDDESVRIA